MAAAPESHDVLDGILGNATDLPITEHATDTHGATLANFALFDLVGKQLSPRIRDLGKITLYRTGPRASFTTRYPHAGPLLTRRLNTDLITAFLERLDLADVTVVANDTGGAITQLLINQHPERVGRVVLTPSDSLERFFPPVFAPLPTLACIPGSMWLLAQLLRVRALQRLPFTFGWVAKRPIPPDIVDSYLLPSRRDAAVRRDLRRFLRGVHRRHTLAAARSLPQFTKPVLLAWAKEDRLFPLELAHRLAVLLPHATVVTFPDSSTFVPEDQPALLARLVVDFAPAHAAT